MAARNQALELLAQGIPASQVAEVIGVTESYVSQLLADEDFAAQLSTLKVESAKKDKEYDDKLDQAEEDFLDRIVERSRMANLQQSMQGFKLLNSAKRRRDSARGAGTGQPQTVVNITLPVAVMPTYILNQQSEIVEVEGKTMVSATPKRLEEIVAQRKVPVQQKLEEQNQERAAEVLQNTVRPVKRITKNLPDSMIVDLL